MSLGSFPSCTMTEWDGGDFFSCLGVRRLSYGADAVALWTGVRVLCHESIPPSHSAAGCNMSPISLYTGRGSCYYMLFHVNKYNRYTCYD